MSRAQQFGRYELLDRVNVGGMAEIFRALDKQSGAVCAVKRILPEIADDEEFIRMFRDEAKIVGQLEHPNICRILELGRVDHDWFLAMQFVEGLDLRAIFDRAIKRSVRLELPFLLHVFMKVCEGLEYAHRKRDAHGRPLNVVHRDVSPQNVLVGFNGDVKVIDFGIAKSNGKLSKTQVGTIKGKYGYMSPEQVRGLPLDHRSDLFSFGICMYELLTQKRLFASDNELLTMERIKEAEFASPRAIEPSIPKTVEQIVLRALARDVTDRYASAADLYADLQAFAYSEGLVWGKDAVADYMQRTFGDGAAKPSPTASHNGRNGALNHATSSAGALPSEPMSSSRRVQENAMSDKGSDLDVFEGLTSKRGTNRPPNSAAAPPPPPPPSRASVPPPPPPGTRRQMATQMGMGLPPMPSVPGAPRTSTPPIAPPPSRQGGGGAPPPPSARNAPPPPAPPPSAQARGAMVDMDWDDEDEKTHVYDKDIVGNAFGPMTSKGVGPMPAPLPPPSHPGPKATMMGMAAPLPPPRTSDRAMPPPPPSRSSRGVPPPPAPPPSNPMMAAPPPPAPPPQSHPLAATQNTGGAPFPQTMVAPMTAPLPAPQPINAPPQVAPAAPARPVADATQVIKTKGGGNAGLIVGALVLAAAAGVGAFFWMSSRPGNVLVNVEVKGPKGTKVSVSLDGAEKCADSTCRIEGVTPGAHTVKAVAGDVEKKATINVEPGKDAIANLTLEVASKKTGVKLASSQTGIKVEIDGGSPRALPVEDDTLKSGDHTLKFTGPGGRYGTKEVKITLEDGQMKTLDDVKLPLKSVKTKFVFLTKGTKAFLDDGTKKSELKDDGQPIELDTTKSYTVTATAPGHEDFSKKIEFGDEPDQAVKLELSEKGKAAAPTPPTPTPPGPVAVAPKPTPTPTPAPAAGGEGSLFVNTLPASACVVDGTPRGKTPFTIKLSPGSHSIMCVAKDGDETLKKSASANVNAGETAKVILKLRD